MSFSLSILFVACKSLKKGDAKVAAKSISYVGNIKPIMIKYCITCHSGPNPAHNFALTTYEEVRLQTEKGEVLTRINSEAHPMPMGGLMPEEQRRIIKKWADKGFKKEFVLLDN